MGYLNKRSWKKVILDVGCGPSKTSLDFKNSKKYIGIDTSQEYIDNANKKYSIFGDFYCLSVDSINKGPLKDISNIDLVILKWVYHHLNDAEIIKLLQRLKNKLSSNGEILSLDPTFYKGRNIANFIVSKYRGINIREVRNLRDLLSKEMKVIFEKVVKQAFPPYQRVFLKISNYDHIK